MPGAPNHNVIGSPAVDKSCGDGEDDDDDKGDDNEMMSIVMITR